MKFKTLLRSLFIQVEKTPNPESLIFKPGKTILPTNSTMEFLSKNSTSPLANHLFRIDGIQSILLGNNFISITKQQDYNWSVLKPEIFSSIMHFFSTNTNPILDSKESALSDSKEPVLSDSDPIVSQIINLLDTRIRPTIQDDGGDVDFVSFSNGTVTLRLKGACRTCDSSTETLKNGIENMMRHYIPGVVSVEQAGDEDDVSMLEFIKLKQKLGE